MHFFPIIYACFSHVLFDTNICILTAFEEENLITACFKDEQLFFLFMVFYSLINVNLTVEEHF